MDRKLLLLAILGVVLVVGVLVLGSGVSTYNKLIVERQGVETQGKQVDTVYQRAFSLLPQITELANGALENETEFVQKVTALRSGACAPQAQAGDLTERDACATGVTETANLAIKIVNEQYPELKSIDLVENVQTEAISSANKIAYEKQLYNEKAGAYNAHIQKCCIPSFIARNYGFEKAEQIGFSDRPNQSSFGTNTL